MSIYFVLRSLIFTTLISAILSACGADTGVQISQTVSPTTATVQATSGSTTTDSQSPIAPTAQPMAGLAPADSQEPATGICASFETNLVTVTINLDTPSPRCAKVTATQRLKVINQTKGTVQVKLAQFAVQLASGEAHTFDATFGSYLAPGVHSVFMSNYGEGAGAELWLGGK